MVIVGDSGVTIEPSLPIDNLLAPIIRAKLADSTDYGISLFADERRDSVFVILNETAATGADDDERIAWVWCAKTNTWSRWDHFFAWGAPLGGYVRDDQKIRMYGSSNDFDFGNPMVVLERDRGQYYDYTEPTVAISSATDNGDGTWRVTMGVSVTEFEEGDLFGSFSVKAQPASNQVDVWSPVEPTGSRIPYVGYDSTLVWRDIDAGNPAMQKMWRELEVMLGETNSLQLIGVTITGPDEWSQTPTETQWWSGSDIAGSFESIRQIVPRSAARNARITVQLVFRTCASDSGDAAPWSCEGIGLLFNPMNARVGQKGRWRRG
jgi:hypothetical protein